MHEPHSSGVRRITHFVCVEVVMFDTMIVASIDKEWLYNDTSKSKSWNVLETVLSHLKLV